MLPNIGFIDTYSVMIVIGIIMAFVFLHIYFKKKNVDKKTVLVIEINGIVAILFGVIFAILFQNIYDFIESPSSYQFSFAMTFYGGLIGGVLGFIIPYNVYFKKKYSHYMKELLIIAPSCITIAHGLGRIGCFLAGCCYGKETDSFLGVKFPGMTHKVWPTNIMEAIFLIILSLVLLFLAIKKSYRYNFTIYMICYGIWRFFIEFLRGDHRGSFIGNISPSQFWSIIIFIGGILYIFIYNFFDRQLLNKNN